MSSFSAIDLEKQKLRNQALAERKEFQLAHVDANEKLATQLSSGLKNIKSGIWVAFKAVRSEADPAIAIERIGGQWAFPKVRGKDLDFYLVNKQSTWEVGPFGIPEPDPQSSQQIDIHLAEGVLVPGVVFDRRGNRLGYGRAFYDRALSQFKGHKVGVAYSVQVRNEIPNESHDVRMDFLATETEFSAVKGQ